MVKIQIELNHLRVGSACRQYYLLRSLNWLPVGSVDVIVLDFAEE